MSMQHDSFQQNAFQVAVAGAAAAGLTLGWFEPFDQPKITQPGASFRNASVYVVPPFTQPTGWLQQTAETRPAKPARPGNGFTIGQVQQIQALGWLVGSEPLRSRQDTKPRQQAPAWDPQAIFTATVTPAELGWQSQFPDRASLWRSVASLANSFTIGYPAQSLGFGWYGSFDAPKTAIPAKGRGNDIAGAVYGQLAVVETSNSGWLQTAFNGQPKPNSVSAKPNSVTAWTPQAPVVADVPTLGWFSSWPVKVKARFAQPDGVAVWPASFAPDVIAGPFEGIVHQHATGRAGHTTVIGMATAYRFTGRDGGVDATGKAGDTDAIGTSDTADITGRADHAKENT